MTSFLPLTAPQARVLACLVEKSKTTPQYYPMTVNALMHAVNQKTCRHPVMSLSEGEVGAALADLDACQLAARAEQGARAVKWRHRFQHQLLLKPESLAVLVTLMLRGPQTSSELRSNASALGGPDGAEEVAAVLEDLEDRAVPLVTALPRGRGQKEDRYAHCLCGEPEVPIEDVSAPRPVASRSNELAQRIERLEARVEELEQRLGQAG